MSTPKRSRNRTIVVDHPLWAQAKEAAYHDRTSVNARVVAWLTRWVEQAQKRHNNGKPFTIPKKEGK
jgi:hypothetical protein